MVIIDRENCPLVEESNMYGVGSSYPSSRNKAILSVVLHSSKSLYYSVSCDRLKFVVNSFDWR